MFYLKRIPHTDKHNFRTKFKFCYIISVFRFGGFNISMLLTLLQRCRVKMLENSIFYRLLRSGYVTLHSYNHSNCFTNNKNDQLFLTVEVIFRYIIPPGAFLVFK